MGTKKEKKNHTYIIERGKNVYRLKHFANTIEWKTELSVWDSNKSGRFLCKIERYVSIPYRPNTIRQSRYFMANMGFLIKMFYRFNILCYIKCFFFFSKILVVLLDF